MSLIKNIFKKKETLITSYSDFWIWFREHHNQFHKVVQNGKRIEKAFFDKISPKLGQLNDGFYYVAGMYNDTTAELIITADGAVNNIVFVEELVQSAPALDGWRFTALKSAMNIEDLNIDMAGLRFDATNLHFYHNNDPAFPDEIDLTIVYDSLNEGNRKNAHIGVNIYLDNLLGELEFATSIDNLNVVGRSEAEGELIPIQKLKSYLAWRQKEFVEKYEGMRHGTEDDNYSLIEGELKNGRKWLATVNTDLLSWDAKASHPWILTVEIKYNGEGNNGMPNNDTYLLLNQIEDEILSELQECEGYLNIGRETADGVREIYFACSEFRKPSKVAHAVTKRYADEFEISYEIYKDKYWRSFNRFSVS
ncbi:DUF695 domain-containing protein [Pontibacter sp. 13R65]|uniref:DUF695 domain-containing protein n=1 Tax=Pontibacter sp. 13R65 TaxID=3127458 RepID=UPI00301BB715